MKNSSERQNKMQRRFISYKSIKDINRRLCVCVCVCFLEVGVMDVRPGNMLGRK